MHWVSGVTMFVVIWWVVIFAVLPFGVTVSPDRQAGLADSAPDKPLLLRKVLITTGISIVLWLACYAVIVSDLISFRDMARGAPL